jgi:DNA-binding CsgD family transcriptional regulator
MPSCYWHRLVVVETSLISCMGVPPDQPGANFMPAEPAEMESSDELFHDVPFVGRETELEHLCGIFDRARQRQPGLVVVEGPAGIGKTALVRQFIRVAGELCVLSASGDEAEVTLCMGLIDQIIRLPPSAVALPHTPVPQDGARLVEPLSVGAAVLDLLGELQRIGTVLIVIDDAHWADHPSLEALTFALRRLRGNRVLVVVLLRDLADGRLPDGFHRLLSADETLRLTLEGLSAAELQSLGKRLGSGRLSSRGAERLRAHTLGNPLYARALLEQLPLNAFEAAENPLPAPQSFAKLILRRLRSCTQEVQDLVTAVSVLGPSCVLDQAAALAQTANPLAALEQAIRAGFLVEQPGTGVVDLSHPLLGAAVYRHLGPARRAGLHAKAAQLGDDQCTRLGHLARAASGQDRHLALELGKLGRATAANGNWSAAGQQLAAAARLMPATAEREQLFLESVDSRLLNGDALDSSGLVIQLQTFTATGWRSYVLARLAFAAGQLDDVEPLLQDAWLRCERGRDAALAARIAAQLATVYILQGRGQYGANWAARALRLEPDGVSTDMLRCVHLFGLGISGQARPALASLSRLPVPALATVAELDALLGRGVLRLWTDELVPAYQDLSGVLAGSHDRSAAFRFTAADALANIEYRLGWWDDACAHSELAVSIAEDADQLWLAPIGGAVAKLIAAEQGRSEMTQASEARRASTPGWFVPLAVTAMADAHVARARRQPEAVIAALEPLRRLSDCEGVREPAVVCWPDLLADALVEVGELEQASDVLVPFETRAAQRVCHSAMAAAARTRGNLEAIRGNKEAAEAAFRAGLNHAAQAAMPFERARLQFAYGAFLRRSGRRSQAADQLRAVHAALTPLNARPDLRRTDQELAACGVTFTRPRTRQLDLTSQELAVARLVAAGMTNRQAARELVISVKTVEYHLGRIYSKLNVASRVELANRLNRA